MSQLNQLRPLAFVSSLRTELSLRNQRYAERLRLPFCESRGELPVICYLPSQNGSRHGNFLPETYQAILKNENWCGRLEKVHSQARTALPRSDRRWRELDSSNSSDALLMNVFCFPGTLDQPRVLALLGIEGQAMPQFGFKARVPLGNGHADRTEVDMKLGDLLVESKLTESDFQSKQVQVVESYLYFSYQLIRNVLAAHANRCSFCVIADARRPDLREAWYSVMRCVQILDLRLRCKMLTWQELSAELPGKLQEFLKEKYGIVPNGTAPLPAASPFEVEEVP